MSWMDIGEAHRERILQRETAISGWLWETFSLKPRYDGEGGALLMLFSAHAEPLREVVLRISERRRMRNWRVDGVEILIQRIEPNAVHGQWARDAAEHKPAILAAINWMLRLPDALDESMGGAARG